jgi:hypothetical protein
MRARFVRWIVSLLILLVAGAALADGRVEFLARRLRFPPPEGLPDDPRVRTQAALNLGGTDDVSVVRHASAAGLKRLGRPAGLPCLKQRLDAEGDESVKVQIQRSIEALEGNSSGSPGGSVPAGTRFYVSIGTTTNNTTRSRGEIDGIVQAAVRGKLQSIGGYAFAPPGESPDAARGVINGNNLHGYYLSPSVARFAYSGGTLRVTVKLAVFTYPGKDYKGDAPGSGSADGVQAGDTSTENELLQGVTQAAAQLFAGGFH